MNILESEMREQLWKKQVIEETNDWLRRLTFRLELSERIEYLPMEHLEWLDTILAPTAPNWAGERSSFFVQFQVGYAAQAQVEDEPYVFKTDGSYYREVFQNQIGLGSLQTDYEWFTALAFYNPAQQIFLPMHQDLFPNIRELIHTKYHNNPTWNLIMPTLEMME